MTHLMSNNWSKEKIMNNWLKFCGAVLFFIGTGISARPALSFLQYCNSPGGFTTPTVITNPCPNLPPDENCTGTCSRTRTRVGGSCSTSINYCNSCSNTTPLTTLEQNDGNCNPAGAGVGLARCECEWGATWYNTGRSVTISDCVGYRTPGSPC